MKHYHTPRSTFFEEFSLQTGETIRDWALSPARNGYYVCPTCWRIGISYFNFCVQCRGWTHTECMDGDGYCYECKEID